MKSVRCVYACVCVCVCVVCVCIYVWQRIKPMPVPGCRHNFLAEFERQLQQSKAHTVNERKILSVLTFSFQYNNKFIAAGMGI